MARKVAYMPPATRAIINAYSVAGFTPQGVLNALDPTAKTALSGAMTANTLKTVLSATGAGTMHHFAGQFADGTLRTMRIKITVDGVVIFDYTSAANTTPSAIAAIISGFSGTSTADETPIRFNSSLLIEAASSLSETDKFTFAWKMRTE